MGFYPRRKAYRLPRKKAAAISYMCFKRGASYPARYFWRGSYPPDAPEKIKEAHYKKKIDKFNRIVYILSLT